MGGIKQSDVFSNLKVVEIAGVLAGPSVGMFFAELGARVIKVENPRTGGDMTRRWRVAGEKPEGNISAYYASINWGKEVLWLDLYEDEGRERLLEELKDADLLISNLKRKSLKKMGLDPATIRKQFPKIIYGQIDAFGPNIDRPAFDAVLQAEVGFMYMNGHPDRPPAKIPVAVIDVLAAHHLKEGLLIALMNRDKTGDGQVVSASLFDSAIATLVNQASNFLMAEHVAQRMGSLHPNIAPYGEVFVTRDEKMILLAVGSDFQFERLCRVLGLDELSLDDRFANNHDRIENRDGLFQILEMEIKKWDREALMEELIQKKVPAGSIRTIKEVFDLPEAQRLILEEKKEDLTTRVVRSVAFNFGLEN
ncbi:MAG: CoA transferase [Saprospiraceae bacterium]|nr:CoA transferase [Saprospiraceae bacterium]